MHSVPIEPEDVNKFPMLRATQMIFSEKDPFGEHFQPKECIVINPPEGFPVEGTVEFFFKIKLDPGDIAAMVRDGHFWVSMIGTSVFPFDTRTEDDLQRDPPNPQSPMQDGDPSNN